MAFTNQIMALLGTMALMSSLGLAQSIEMAYCASINTASTAANSSIYQSDGLCHDFCLEDYAFSVIKDSECWCSNYVPAESAQVDVDQCNKKCPGYLTDTCGGDGVWGYMSLDKVPSGTSGSSTSTQTSSPDPITKTVHNTVTVTPTVPSTVSSTTAVPDTTSKSTEHTTSPTSTPSPSVATVTVGGTVSLVTVTPTVPVAPVSSDVDASSDNNSSGMTTSHQGLSTGQAVGVAVGVLGAVAIAIGAGVFLCLRRRRRDQRDVITDSPGSHRGSSAGMMSTPTTGMASVWDGDNTSSGRRNSRFMPHDPRMDPFATNIYSRFDNKSHESVNTLQDNQDYSRKVLRTTNPDPPDAVE